MTKKTNQTCFNHTIGVADSITSFYTEYSTTRNRPFPPQISFFLFFSVGLITIDKLHRDVANINILRNEIKSHHLTRLRIDNYFSVATLIIFKILISGNF